MQGEVARAYCSRRDETLLGLIRIGRKGIADIIKKEKVLDWLLQRGDRALHHVIRQENAIDSLRAYGKFMKRYVNQRNAAVEFLCVRQQISARLLANQKVAIAALRKCPLKFWAKEDQIIAARDSLIVTGRRALDHIAKQNKAVAYLQVGAPKKSVIYMTR
jgi:hypothetical protein